MYANVYNPAAWASQQMSMRASVIVANPNEQVPAPERSMFYTDETEGRSLSWIGPDDVTGFDSEQMGYQRL